MLLAVIVRRSYRASRLSQLASNHGRTVWVAGLGGAIFSTILFSAFNGSATSIGAIAIVSIFTSVLVTVLTGLRLDSIRGAPILVLSVVCAFVFSSFDWNNNHVIHEAELSTPKFAFNSLGPDSTFESRYRSRKDLEHFTTKKKTNPVFIIAARGGGIYAAENRPNPGPDAQTISLLTSTMMQTGDDSCERQGCMAQKFSSSMTLLSEFLFV